MEETLKTAEELLATFGLRIVGAVVIVVLARFIARWLTNVVRKFLGKKEFDPTLVSFVANTVYFALLTFAVLAALSQLGIETTSFIAVLGAAGLAVGLALQGALANFAAGVLLIVFRPMKVGHFVQAGGEMGTVEEIQIFTTKLISPDNREIVVPNGKIMGDTITNFSAKDSRRVDLVFGIGYGDNILRAKEVIGEILSKDERVLQDPPATIGVMELGDSRVNLAARPWVRTTDYWSVYFDTNEKVKQAFDAAGITIPFPQRDVHLYEHRS